MKLDIGCGAKKKDGFIGVNLIQAGDTDIIADARDLPYEDNTIEEIYMRRVLQHIKEENKTLSEAYRVLQPNGKIQIISVSIWGYLFYLVNDNGKFIRPYTKRSLARKLENAGFKVTRTYTIKNDRLFGYDVACEAVK
jgi:ubiquinone/menaquinone biosynthesis C-methylase UbiE